MRTEAKEHSALLQVINETFINATVLKTVRGVATRRKMNCCLADYVADAKCKFSVGPLLIHMRMNRIPCSIELHASRIILVRLNPVNVTFWLPLLKSCVGL